jgi:hypothetical protein
MKISCNEAQALLERFIQEELSPDDAGLLETHLGECATCQQVLEGETWERFLKDLPVHHCPDRINKKIEAFIETETQKARQPRLIHWHWRQTVFAGLAAAAMIVIFVIHSERSSPPVMQQTQYSEEDIEKAREVMKWTMVYTAQRMQQSKTKVIDDVFTKHLPGSVQKSIRKALPILQGETK